MKLSEYVLQVVNDPKYGHDIEWVKGNLHRAHIEEIEAAHDADVRAADLAEQGETVPEDAEVSYWTTLDGDYAEECSTLAQAEYVRREARGHVPVAERKITKRVEFWLPVPDTTNTESEGKA